MHEHLWEVVDEHPTGVTAPMGLLVMLQCM